MGQKESDFLDDMTKATEPEALETPDPEKVEEVEKGEPEPEPEKAEPEKKAEATPAPEVNEITGLKTGLKAEREKRQERDRQLKERDRQIAELNSQLQARQQAAPAFFEAPEAYIQHIGQQIEAQASQRLMSALDAQARDAFDDYDEVLTFLTEQAEGNPALAQQVMNSPNPAVAAYKLGKQLREMERMQDLGAYKAQIRAEARAEWEAEQKAKDDAKARAAAEIPPDLAAARNATAETQAREGTVFDNLFSG